ncbi:FecCD family ABC transporter permease [Streptomyces lycii]|uniref:Iron chelate uptake ABC transporter family permease subunit n=1 Tax=Streptomyces lycii TaxID=2654337 RepID=A0ABQ7FFK1_9ACTN|nr:iron chelate uptake ABC transporter family permease subunit [Streptomyces lycii]
MNVLRIRGLSLRTSPRALFAGALTLLAALALGVALIATGDFPMAPAEVLNTLAGYGTPAQEFIVNELRLPRVLVALFTGVALGISGAVFQSVSRNPLGSPDILGLGNGAAAGALTVIVVFDGSAAAVSAGAIAGGLLTGFGVYALAWRRGVHGYRLVLVGIGAAAMLYAVIGYLLTKADLVDAARALIWLTGSLEGRDWEQFWPLLAVCAVLAPLALGQGRALRMLEMGDDAAYAMGVPVERTRLVALSAAVLLSAVAASAVGPVAFVALAAPQLARRLTRTTGPNLLPAACMGAALMTGADWASQQVFGAGRVPVGVLTAVLGGGYLLWLLVAERKAGRL